MNPSWFTLVQSDVIHLWHHSWKTSSKIWCKAQSVIMTISCDFIDGKHCLHLLLWWLRTLANVLLYLNILACDKPLQHPCYSIHCDILYLICCCSISPFDLHGRHPRPLVEVYHWSSSLLEGLSILPQHLVNDCSRWWHQCHCACNLVGKTQNQ